MHVMFYPNRHLCHIFSIESLFITFSCYKSKLHSSSAHPYIVGSLASYRMLVNRICGIYEAVYFLNPNLETNKAKTLKC